MTIFTIDEYKAWRKQMLANPPDDIIKTPRGTCHRLKPFIVHDRADSDFHLKSMEIEDAEFALVYHNKITNPTIIARLYENDDALLAAYRKLDLERHFNQKRRLSRSNVVCVPECCLCYWQQHDQHLTVVSRSLDVKRAGLSDLVIVNRIALAQRCTTFTFHAVCPHIYTDSSKIARRS